jgi:hypothetical protein
MKKKHKSNIPAFIPNQPGAGYFGFDQGERSKQEAFKNRENQKKLALRNRK